MALRHLFAVAVAVAALALDVAAASGGSAALGVNYGQVADNLPSPQAAAVLLRALNATKVKLYDADARVLSAFAGSGVDFTVGLPDNMVPRLASDPSAAAAWVRTNILPHLPATSITAVIVGNEVLTGSDATMLRSLLPAMQSLHAALAACNLTSRVAVTTAHSLAVLSSSFPPSSAAFRHDLLPYITPLLAFLAKTGSPFLVNAYPYFAYKADPGTVDLDYVLFEPSAAAVVDSATGLRYGNMLHAQLDRGRRARRDLRRRLRAGGGDPGVGDRVAVAGGRRRGRRHAAERGQVQREPDAAGGAGEGHAGGARGAAAGVRVRPVQRGPEARAGVGAALRPVQAGRRGGIRRQRQGADDQRLEG
uniref:Glucan endo-1,3-beta-glucosidase 11 n=1 Tax=Triticum urartu TaxID=4572 RepID=A0A8R7P0D9_TRIUA